MNFKDHFSQHADAYARFRPAYPAALFEYLAGIARAREFAWDCATGNGQAALALVPYFAQVLATDASVEQIRHAQPQARVTYAVASAESVPVPSASVDLVTVAQALHWFDFERFYDEARRVLKPNGVLAAWGYGLNAVERDVDAVVDRYYREIVGPYWPPERRYLDDRYATIPFALPEIMAPAFRMEASWDLHEFRGYLATWSAGQRFERERGRNPLELIDDALRTTWGEADRKRRVVWPVYLRVGRNQ